MILIDMLNLSYRCFYIALGKDAYTKTKIDINEYKGMIIHLIFNNLKHIQTDLLRNFPNEIVIATESSSWRKDFYPDYKANRKPNESIDIEEFYSLYNEILTTIRETLPYKVIKVNKAEGDDIIAILSNNSNSSTLVVSEDKDFEQLLKNKNISIYKPIKKQFISNININDINKRLLIHILVGDKVDNIPSILEGTKFSDKFLVFLEQNNIFTDNVNDFENMEISKKLYESYTESPFKPAYFGEKTAEQYLLNLDENLNLNKKAKDNFNRNRCLIDFDFIPEDIKINILNEYNNIHVNNEPDKLMKYFLINGCRNHANCVSLFSNNIKTQSSIDLWGL